ncbi:hypothetical protein PG995_000089 [Apiospora arundinis]
MALYDDLKHGHYNSVFESFDKRSWGSKDDNVFPLNDVIGKSKRPCKSSFSSTDEYFATIGLGAKVIQTLTEREQGFKFDSVLRILKQDDNGLIAIVETPKKTKSNLWKNPSTSIVPGDRGFVHLRYSIKGGTDDSEPIRVGVRLAMEFIEPFPSSPPGFLAAKLQPRQKRERRSPYDFSLGKDEAMPDLWTIPEIQKLLNDLEDAEAWAFVLKTIQHIKVPQHLSAQACMSHILEQEGTPGYVDTVIRHSEFCFVFEAWEKLQNQGGHIHTSKYLSAPSEKAPQVDIYSRLEDKSLVDSDCLQLNPSQKEALDLTRTAPAGFVIAHGGPGTGKTHFIIQAAKPFFLDKRHHRLLLTSAGNRGADSIAEELNKWLQSLDESVRRDSYIVRLHSLKTEAKIFLGDAEQARQLVLTEKARKAAQKSEHASGSKAQNDAISNHYLTYGSGKLKSFGDDRVQNIKLAVGTMMKKKLPLHPKMQIAYDRYSRGEIIERKAVREFHRQVYQYMERVISGAGAVCATVSGVGDTRVREGYKDCDLIVVDEAARVPEYQWWPLLAFYQSDNKVVGKIMVGDHLQMGPISNSDERKSPMYQQMALSLQARFQDQGIPSQFFTTQYRAVSEIAEIYNRVIYNGRLDTAEETYVEARPLAQDIVKYNEIAYGAKSSVVFFDVAGALEQNELLNGEGYKLDDDSELKGKPKFCNQYVFTVSRILEGLISAGFCSGLRPASIAVLTPYKVEFKRLIHVQTKMKYLYPQVGQVHIETVGKVQGREYDIVIVDPAATTRPSRFLDSQLLNVMFSRARCGLYVLGCEIQWNIMFDETSAYPLSRFAEELKSFKKRYPSTADEECPESNEFYNPDDFKKVAARQRQ